MTDMSASYGTPPGWHHDPWMPGGMRWWDGQIWTSYAIPPAGWAAVEAATPEMIATARRWCDHASKAFMAQAVVGILNALFLPLLVSYFFQWIQESVENPEATPELPAGPTLGILLLNVVSLATTVALIVLAIWAFNGTKAARALGQRTTHSPGWAAGGWFIPIVNYWFPYQAVHDLVPEGHPVRPRVIAWWLCHLLGPLTIVLPVAVAWFSITIALAVAIVPITLAVVTAVLGTRIAGAVGEAFDEAATTLADSQIAN